LGPQLQTFEIVAERGLFTGQDDQGLERVLHALLGTITASSGSSTGEGRAPAPVLPSQAAGRPGRFIATIVF
jgi:hypothetical protein